MGIRQSFTRITAQQLDHVQRHPSRTLLRDMLATTARDEHFFWPMDEPRPFARVRSLTFEKSYWELLERTVTAPCSDDPLPVWPITEANSPVLPVDLSDIYYLDPPAVTSFALIIPAFSRARLARRYGIDLQQQDASGDEEKDWLFEAMMLCLDTLAQFVQYAAAQEEAIVWHIG